MYGFLKLQRKIHGQPRPGLARSATTPSGTEEWARGGRAQSQPSAEAGRGYRASARELSPCLMHPASS